MYRDQRRRSRTRATCGVPLRADFALDVPAMLAAIERERPALVWLAYPNNPTGNRVRRATASSASLARRAGPGGRRRGVLRVRRRLVPAARARRIPTSSSCARVSKIGMAGLRLGYAVGPPALDRRAREGAPAVQRRRRSRRRSRRCCSPPRDGAGRAGRRDRAPSARALAAALAALPRLHASSRPRPTSCSCACPMRRRAFAALRAARHPGQESARVASAARALPAHHGRHARRERRRPARARAAIMNAPSTPAAAHAPQVQRDTAETQIAVRVDLDGSGRTRLATGIPFLDHMLDQVARHGMLDLDGRRQGRPAHRRAPHGRGRRHHARARRCARRSATRWASAATATPTCRSTRRCRAW